jgi:methionyl-tRNA formyltransferase
MKTRILIYGSTALSAIAEHHLLLAGYNVVGHVPSNATFQGAMSSPVGEFPCDIKLSVQYDKKLIADGKTFNIHTGLLPQYGGCNILSHTILNGAMEQGLTFHKVSDTFDGGEILLKMVYPVLANDTVKELYWKMLSTIGNFSVLCMDTVGWNGHKQTPTLYKRNDLDEETQRKHIEEIRLSLQQKLCGQ